MREAPSGSFVQLAQFDDLPEPIQQVAQPPAALHQEINSASQRSLHEGGSYRGGNYDLPRQPEEL